MGNEIPENDDRSAAAGSEVGGRLRVIRSPPATLRNTSCSAKLTPHQRAARTAKIIDSPVRIPADGGTAGRARASMARQALGFRPATGGCPRCRRTPQRTWCGRVPVAEEQLGRVRHLGQAVADHLEHADLVAGTEPVLHRPQDAIGMSAVAFEIQHGVDHVLDHLRSRRSGHPW